MCWAFDKFHDCIGGLQFASFGMIYHTYMWELVTFTCRNVSKDDRLARCRLRALSLVD